MPSAWLEIQDGPEAGKRFEISAGDDTVVLGRSPDCAIVVAAPSISRKHARLVRVGQGFRLEDLASANGTFVNGVRIEDGVDVRDQDRIVLGSVGLLLVIPPEPQADATIAVAPESDATIAIPPAERASAASRRAPAPEAPPPAPEPTAPAPPIAEPIAVEPAAAKASPLDEAVPETAARAAETKPALTATRPASPAATPALTATRPAFPAATPAPRAPSGPPGIAELVAIGVASFFAVYGLGWLLG